MSVLSPIWLVGLAPWIVVCAWLLWGRHRRVQVPFLPLWQGPVTGPRAQRNIQAPPIAAVLVLLAIFLGIVAAARPTILGAGSRGEPALSLIVDRGLSMSARGAGDLRYRQTAAGAWPALTARFAAASIDLIPIPGDGPVRSNLRDCPALIQDLPPTAIDTGKMLRAAVTQRLAASTGPVVVISDQPLSETNDRLIEIAPETAVQDVGIANLAAREQPSPQVMVKLRNQSAQTGTLLVVSSAGRSVAKQIELPDRGAERNYFFDLPRLGSTVSAELRVGDELAADDRAWLVREGSSPRIEPRSPLPPELRRMIDVYQQARPPSDVSSRLAMVGNVSQLPGDSPAVVLAAPQTSMSPGTVQVAQHPVTEHVRWERLPGPMHWAGNPPEGWTPLVSIGGHVLVAVRPQPPRQAWVGLDAPRWATTPDYVIFWTNVFTWVGGGRETFVGYSLDKWSPEWKPQEPAAAAAGLWPGVYRRSDGALRAFNPPDLDFAPPPHPDWRAGLSALALKSGRLDLAAPLLALAAACLALAAATWTRRFKPAPRTYTSSPA